MKQILKQDLPLSSICLLVVTGIIVATFAYGSSSTSSVAATVTAQNISIGVGDGTVAYGSIALSGSASTTAGDKNDSQSATNTGNVTENFNMKGQDTACPWTLAGTAASEQYAHKFCNNGTCDASPSWTALTTNYQQFGASITTTNTQEFDLQILVPTASACFTEQSADIIVQAVAA